MNVLASHQWLFKAKASKQKKKVAVAAYGENKHAPPARIMCKPELISGHCLVAVSSLFVRLPEAWSWTSEPYEVLGFQQALPAEPGQISHGVITLRCCSEFSVSLKNPVSSGHRYFSLPAPNRHAVSLWFIKHFPLCPVQKIGWW